MPVPDRFVRRILDLVFVFNAAGMLVKAATPALDPVDPRDRFPFVLVTAAIGAALWLLVRAGRTNIGMAGFIVLALATATIDSPGLLPAAIVSCFVHYGIRNGIKATVAIWLAGELSWLVAALLDLEAGSQFAWRFLRTLLDPTVLAVLGIALVRHRASDAELAAKNQELAHAHDELRAQAELRQELLLAQDRARSARVLNRRVGTRLAAAAQAMADAGSIRLDDPPGARAELAAARAQLASALLDVRRWVRAMNPANGGGGVGLERLHAVADSFRGTGLQVHVDAPEDHPELGAEQDLYVVRFMQEGLANALRDGGASAVWTVVRVGDGWLRIQLFDDGRTPAVSPDAAGVRWLRDRAAELGGRFELATGGSLSEISAQLPLLVDAAVPAVRPEED